MQYKTFTHKRFISFLCSCKSDVDGFVWFDECSGELEEKFPINEYVYKIKLDCGWAHLLVFTSISKNNEITRAKGKDAVRVIYVWKKYGVTRFAHVKTNLRVENLFVNLKRTLISAINNRKQLRGRYEWKNEL